ncbi:MAG: peptide/nickel transport system substrate-binding protein [Chloroflexi bacterium]|nr:MAG: peptide/nickel transport system substrate-binding protein [Chloroflexota bacterium]
MAGASLEAGDIDYYMFSLKTEAARQAANNEDITLYRAPASSISLLLNPAPAPEGELNPFSIKDVRYALQYAVNRQFIAQEIYKGLAEPMLAHVGPFDYDYQTTYQLLKEQDITYDPEFAAQLVAQAMNGAGATLVGGRWEYEGKPIRLNFIIRVEDERRDVGDLIRAELEDLGFTISTSYLNFAPAILSVYSSDPQLMQWHLYTEGWGRGSAERYDYATVNSMAAPWLGNMPGWQEVGFWQYENQRLDDLGKQLFQGVFQNAAERDAIYQEMTGIAIDESVRIWLATVVNSLPAANNLQGVTEDVTAGPKSIWTLREAYIPGRDTLEVGNLWVATPRTTWNPIGGFGDVYSVDIWRTINDPPLWRDPFSGDPVPFRATYDVTTAGPAGKLDVPAGTVQWDAVGDRFAPVAPGARATSKVVFDYSKYFQSKWHHGQSITMADVLYSIAQRFELALDEDKSRIEVALAVTSLPFLETVRGIRVLDDDRLEVYVDYWHFAEDYIADYASISGLSMPWEVLAAMDEVVFEDRRAAYSATSAQRFSVPWINLVLDNDSRLVRRALLSMQDEDRFPSGVFEVGGKSYVSNQDAQQRYEAALAWIAEYGMAVISNGPFQLVRYDPPAQFAEVEAFRDPTYPFKPGDWYHGSPPAVTLRSVETTSVGIGSSASFDFQILGPGEKGARYVLRNPATGAVLGSGTASTANNEDYSIDLPSSLTGGLAPGLYHLFVLGFSDQVSTPVERRVDLDVVVGQPDAPTSAPTDVSSTPTPAATAVPRSSGGFCSGPSRMYEETR